MHEDRGLERERARAMTRIILCDTFLSTSLYRYLQGALYVGMYIGMYSEDYKQRSLEEVFMA